MNSQTHDPLARFADLIEQEIRTRRFTGTPQSLYRPIRYIMNLGGKRVRPLLVIMAYLLYKKNIDRKTVSLAIAIEVLHNFTLMHDDIMDQASLRRGKPTVQTKWGVNTAILSGDAMLVKVYDLLLAMPPHLLGEGLARFNACVTAICEGQQWDIEFERQPTVKRAEYLRMIQHKTAVLLGFSLEFGAFLAEAPAADQALLREVGIDIGVGFQLIDDLLDVYPSKNGLFGKTPGGDILTNKKTFLWVAAMERASETQRGELLHWMNSSQPTESTQKIQAVEAIYNSLGVADYTRKSASRFFRRGLSRLDTLEVTYEEPCSTLRNFITSLIDRTT